MRTRIASLYIAVTFLAGCAANPERPPEGNITVKGTLADDAQTFQGKVIYFDGKILPMTGRRR